MDYLVCIDDTDMPGTKGTGWLVQDMCEHMEGIISNSSPISRHQLFVHKDIPYTSHNSSMCFEMNLVQNDLPSAINTIISFIKDRAMDGSDPGLCVARKSDVLANQALLDFGKAAKRRVLSKDLAYNLADKIGIHLSEHGGTGDGIIGAIAGVGLRLTGNDGRYRGWYHLGNPGTTLSVETFCKHPFIEQLVTESGEVLPKNLFVAIGSEKIKTVRKGSRQVVVVKEISKADEIQADLKYRTITSIEAKLY
ncbi:hypothetical protein [Desulfotalea psychrophila]|uniref:DUF1743 domain-containing protein n=1 Tax=Desulfotalea psychrophila (strain LSv54 / DSM 12343) TaxID=177439 RepID=Q6APD4_DESPS|nr:hypothetical protein [Desulfotalea psychrophila]CAG35790.1 unknown protein [Desulfotalea psychrophila LSv54]